MAYDDIYEVYNIIRRSSIMAEVTFNNQPIHLLGSEVQQEIKRRISQYWLMI